MLTESFQLLLGHFNSVLYFQETEETKEISDKGESIKTR